MTDLSKDLGATNSTEVKMEIPSFTKSVDLPNVKASSDTTVTITKAATFKFRSKSKKSDYHPTEQELADLNGTYSLVDWNPEDLYVFTMLAATLEEDRQNEFFLPPGLYDAARVLKGKTWLYDPHEWKTSNEVGRIMDAWVEDDSSLMLKVYILNTPENQKFLNNVFAGIHSGISIGFTSRFEDMLCMSCAKAGKTVSIYDKNNCYHQPGAYDEFGGTTKVAIAGVLDGFEVSNAPVPAQKPASILSKAMPSLELENVIVTEEVQGEKVKTETELQKTLQLQDENLEQVKDEMKELEEMKSADLMPEGEVETDNEEVVEDAGKTAEDTDSEKADSADTIKSESSIIQDSKDMSEDTQVQEEKTIEQPEMVDLKSVLDGLSNLNENLEALKGSMTELLTVVTESKEMLSRFSTPKDGEDQEWATRTVKQEEQAQILENLVEKTVKVLETLSNDGSKEQKPIKNEWARKLAKKLVSEAKN